MMTDLFAYAVFVGLASVVAGMVVRFAGVNRGAALAIGVVSMPVTAAVLDAPHLRDRLLDGVYDRKSIQISLARAFENPAFSALLAGPGGEETRAALHFAAFATEDTDAATAVVATFVQTEVFAGFNRALPTASSPALMDLVAAYSALAAERARDGSPAEQCLEVGHNGASADRFDHIIASVIMSEGSSLPRAPSPALFERFASTVLPPSNDATPDPCTLTAVILAAIVDAPETIRDNLAVSALQQ